MISSKFTRTDLDNNVFEYLCVDNFIRSVMDAWALRTSFDLCLFDHLDIQKSRTFDYLQNALSCDRPGLKMLLDLLMANHIVEQREGGFYLSGAFQKALQYRDLLEAKLDFSQLAALDFFSHFTSLIRNPDGFMRDARTIQLFDYQQCFELSPESCEQTKCWMRFMTLMTKYEAQVCMSYHDFSVYNSMLDIGGNSGEFVLQVCKRYPTMRATVFDLPVVCNIGAEHVSTEPEAGRINFRKGNAITDSLPTNFDLVTFKSMLHDWPARNVKQLLCKARACLNPRGTLLIFERAPIQVGERGIPYSFIPIFLFFRLLRPASVYKELLEAEEFHDIAIQRIQLETPFWLVTATK